MEMENPNQVRIEPTNSLHSNSLDSYISYNLINNKLCQVYTRIYWIYLSIIIIVYTKANKQKLIGFRDSEYNCLN